MRFSRARLLALVAALALLGGLLLVNRGSGQTTVTARFDSLVGVYEGSEVRLMGVPIGTVTRIEPGPAYVTVTLSYDDTYQLPADAKAVIVSPSVIADRFVQLTPAYSGSGSTLASGALIPLERTATPVELDRIYESTNDVLEALGPNGANKDGALSDLVGVSARNLAGNGPAMRAMWRELGGALDTLGKGSDDFFGTVEHLNALSVSLATHDQDVRRFTSQLAQISTFLGGEGAELQATLRNLASAFAIVQTFVEDNRELLSRNMAGLIKVTGALVAERDALQAIIEMAPLGLNNLNRTWDVGSQAVRTRSNSSVTGKNMSGALCDAFIRSDVPDPETACLAIHALLDGTRS